MRYMMLVRSVAPPSAFLEAMGKLSAQGREKQNPDRWRPARKGRCRTVSQK